MGKKSSNESMIAGEFGEVLVEYLLAKEGVEVIRSPKMGFDLFAIDKKGRVLHPSGKLIGISVKTRLHTKDIKYSPTIPIDSKKIMRSKRRWNIRLAWIALVVGCVGQSLKVFLLPYTECRRFRGRASREDVISIRALGNDTSGTVRILLHEKSTNI